MKPLGERLDGWGTARGWHLALGVSDFNDRICAATMGPTTGYGNTTNEAINNLADGLLEEGWPDDRGPQCDRCERYAETTYFPEYGAEFCAECGADPLAPASRDSQAPNGDQS